MDCSFYTFTKQTKSKVGIFNSFSGAQWSDWQEKPNCLSVKDKNYQTTGLAARVSREPLPLQSGDFITRCPKPAEYQSFLDKRISGMDCVDALN